MRWRFWKYCSSCDAIFGSNDIEEFMQMLKNHVCKLAVSVSPQFITCGHCGLVGDEMLVYREKGKVKTACPSCGSENIHSSYA